MEKNQKEIVELKDTIIKIKKLTDGLNSRAEMTEDRVSELETKSIEFNNLTTERQCI